MSFPAYADRRYIHQASRLQYERRIHPDDSGLSQPRYQYRKLMWVTYYAELDAYSAINDFLLAVLIPGSAMAVGSPTIHVGTTQTNATMPTLTLTGSWNMDDVQIDDQGNGTAKVTFSASQEGQWYNPDGSLAED
jgi:hypothetical protein